MGLTSALRQARFNSSTEFTHFRYHGKAWVGRQLTKHRFPTQTIFAFDTGEVTIEIATPADGTIYSMDKTPLSKGVYTVFVRDSSAGVIAELKPER